MNRAFATLCTIILVSPAVAGGQIAEVFCDDRDTMVLRLERSHGAERTGRGMRGPEAIVEIWTVPSTGEWTLVQSYPNGISCIVAMGENWEALGEALPAEPA